MSAGAKGDRERETRGGGYYVRECHFILEERKLRLWVNKEKGETGTRREREREERTGKGGGV